MHEYDPLLQQKDTIKYRINSLNDPTKRDMYKTLKVGGGRWCKLHSIDLI